MAINEEIKLSPFEPVTEQVKEREELFRGKTIEESKQQASDFKYTEEEMALSERKPRELKSLTDELKRDISTTQAQQDDVYKEMGLGITARHKADMLKRKGLRVGGKMVSQAAYSHAVGKRAEVVGQLSAVVSRANGLDQNMVATHLNNKLKSLELQLIRKAAEMQKLAAKEKWDKKKKKAFGAMWGSIAGAVAGGAIGGIATAGNPMGVAAGASVGGSAGGKIGSGMA